MGVYGGLCPPLLAFIEMRVYNGRLLAAGVGHTGHPGFYDNILMRRWTFIVLLAPDEVPCGRDSEETGKYNGCIVHSPGSDGIEVGIEKRGVARADQAVTMIRKHKLESNTGAYPKLQGCKRCLESQGKSYHP